MEFIGEQAFVRCSGLYGSLHLPDNLKEIRMEAFMYCENLTGNLIIPQGVKIIPRECFAVSGFNGNLQLHDGITAIEEAAFENTHLRGDLKLPKELNVISDYSFLDVIFWRIVTSEFTDLYRRRCLLRKLAPDGNTRNSAGCGEHWQRGFC